MDSGKPVTKADFDLGLRNLENKFVDAMRSQKDELVHSMRVQKDELIESMRQIETNLLTGFHLYAKGQNARVHNVEVGEADMKLRLSVLEDRVQALETRLPPSTL